MSEGKPAAPRQPENEQDEDAISFAQGIFDLARNGGTDMLSPLLDAGVPVDMRTSEGDTLLMLATRNGHRDTARLLLVKGADPDRADHHQRTPLMQAAMDNQADITDLLLGCGANQALTDAEGDTALDLARTHHASAVIRILEPLA